MVILSPCFDPLWISVLAPVLAPVLAFLFDGGRWPSLPLFFRLCHTYASNAGYGANLKFLIPIDQVHALYIAIGQVSERCQIIGNALPAPDT